MKSLVSLFLILATWTGVLTATDSVCLESHEAQIMEANYTGSPMGNSAPAPASDCHHEGSPCHSCHLGHCAFVVTTASSDLVAPVKEIAPHSYLALLPSDYPASLFRPPIS